MGVSISISITQNSQNITNNTTNTTVTVKASWTNGSHNLVVDANGTPQANGWLKIGDTKYTFASVFNKNKTSSGSQTIFTKTVNVSHNSDGTKTLSCSASYSTGVNAGTVTASKSKTFTTIPRKSDLSVGNGTLGAAQILTVTRKSSNFTHTIIYTCGGTSGTIVSKSSDTSISFTPPLSLASQNTKGTSVSVRYTITTYNGNTSIGSNSYTKTCTIPATIKPTCKVSISDVTGYYTKYGTYIKGYSRLAVSVNGTGSYSSTVTSYSTKANGLTYTSASFTTEALTGTGTQTVNATVKDSRGRSASASASYTVLDYTPPLVNSLKVKRCNADGTENIKGEYAQVIFSASVLALNDKNSSLYMLQYKKRSDTEYTVVSFDSLKNTYAVNDVTHIFIADSGSSYAVRIVIKDDFTTITQPTVISTAAAFMHWRADGDGIGFGKIGEVKHGADFGYVIKPNEGFINIPIEAGTDFNNLKTPNIYISYDGVVDTYVNCPLSWGTFTLEVASGGNEGQVVQTLTFTSKDNFTIQKRFYYQGTWGKWQQVYSVAGNVLWSGAWYMHEDHTANLSQKVSEQPHGIVLVFSSYYDGTARDYHFNSFFVPKKQVANHATKGHSFFMVSNPRFEKIACKYLYLHDDKVVGNEDNNLTGTANGITYANNYFVLRYVIGV